MSISTHDTIAQRFTVTNTTQYGDVVFGTTSDEHSSSYGCAISPTPNAQLRKGAEDYFRQIHAQQNPLWQGTNNQALVAIYQNHLTPLDTLPRLSFEDAEQLLHNLLDQIQTSSHLFPHGIRMTDMGLNEDGHLILRASGVLPKDNHVRPEIITTQGTPLQKSLYSIAIHILSTLAPLPTIESKRQLEEFQSQPPQLSSISPDASQQLSSLLSTMMHPDPSKRDEALQHLRNHDPLSLSIPSASITTETAKKQTRSLPQINTRRDLPLPQWLIFSKEKRIPINIARRVSVFSGIMPNRITTDSHQIPIAGADTESQAQRIAKSIQEAGVQVEVRHQDTGPKVSSILGLSVFLSAISYALSFGLFITILPLLLGFATAVALGFFSANRKQHAYSLWNETHAASDTHQSILQGQQITREARKSIMNSAVPELAKIDLHATIDEIDDIIDGHHETQTPLSESLLSDILTTCSELTEELTSSQEENHMLKIRKKTQQIQKVARKMRSL